jgi:hypothetical protein
MTTHALAHRPSPSGDTPTPANIWTSAGTLVPAADVHAQRIAREAERWLALATERTRMRPDTLTAKALKACAFSVQRRAASLAVPSKLVGTSRHQPRLRALADDSTAQWAVLDLDAVDDGLLASRDGAPLGLVQSKHLGWVRPLLPFGLTVHLSRVTGAPDNRRYRLGCNVAFGGVGEALRRLSGGLGETGGDGAQHPAPSEGAPGSSALRLVVPGEARPIGVPVRPEYEALTGDPEDVVLWRTLEGEAHASIPHAARHSPTGIEWGYGGSGPADLARSVLLALTDEPTANALYQRFKHEVVASVPEAGGVLRAADVRRWIERAMCHAR